MKNFKCKHSGAIYPIIGTFKNEDGILCYKKGNYVGIRETEIELTNEPTWIKISFNLRLRYDEVMDSAKYIRSIGGDGNATVGGSWFFGSKDMIDKLIQYMADKDYNLDSLSFKDCQDAKQNQKK